MSAFLAMNDQAGFISGRMTLNARQTRNAFAIGKVWRGNIRETCLAPTTRGRTTTLVEMDTISAAVGHGAGKLV